MNNPTLSQLETPFLLLDVVRMDANIARIQKHLHPLGVTLRPHVKTNKCIAISDRFFDTPQRPITVSTLHEADFFFANGYTDILYAVAIAPNKFAHVKKLLDAGANLRLILDNSETAKLLREFALAEKFSVNILLEIDSDGHRSGLPPCAPAIADIVALLKGSPVTIQGVMTHAGDSYGSTSTARITRCAQQERDAVVHSANMLRDLGVEVSVVSVGSTPTALFCDDLTGVTEVRAGVFVFFDLFMHGIGVCGVDELALSVVTTVIGHQREKGWVITDAGWMALSRDRGTAGQRVDQGYGIVCRMDGTPYDNLIVSGANQEHGIVSARDGKDTAFLDELSVGTQVRILPNHACATAAQYAGYHLCNHAGPETYWQRTNGWK